MSATHTPAKKPVPPLSSQDLARVEDALEGIQIQIKETKIDDDTSVPPAVFGAGGPMSVIPVIFGTTPTEINLPLARLKQFDQSTQISRVGSQAATPPRSVVGIGNKGKSLTTRVHLLITRHDYPVAKPDYSEAKIVVAMVRYTTRELIAL